MTAPRIRVGLPAWRGEAFLAESLRSLQAQSFRDFAVLISVDAADHPTAAIAQPFLADPRFRLVVQPERLHWAGNINWLWARNDAEFFVYHQQDDLLDPRYLEALLALADRSPDAALVFSDLRHFGQRDADSAGRDIAQAAPFERVLAELRAFNWQAIRGLVRRAALQAAGPVRVDTGEAAGSSEAFGEEFVWLVRIAREGKLIRLPETLYFKRLHGASLTESWFTGWPMARRRRALLALGASLLRAALPAAQTRDQRLELLQEVLERLVQRPFLLPVQRLDAEGRAVLIREICAELRREGDLAEAFGPTPEAFALARFGLAPAPGEAVLRARLDHAPGITMDLRDPNTAHHRVGAWGDPDAEGVWTHGAEAELVLWPRHPAARLLALRLRPYLAAWRASLVVDLAVDGVALASWTLAEAGGFVWITARLPPAPDGPLRLSLRFPGLEVPEALGLPADAPILGLCVQALTLR